MIFHTHWYVIPAAFVLDLLLGDPIDFPHPVRLMGKAIQQMEIPFRMVPVNQRYAGALFAMTLIAAAWGGSVAVVAVTHAVGHFIGVLAEIVLVYYCISARSLERAAMDVYGSLSRNDLQEARDKVALIVGRDTQLLDEQGVIRASVETVAENLVDGVMSPLFFAAIGGAPLAIAYKMVNTLDSMVGYKNETYIRFGKAAARIDDIANFIPARISVLVISLATTFLNMKGARALKTAFREGSNHTSPNAGYPEAAFAGALGVKLNGPNVYFGQWVDKPFIGRYFGAVALHHIKQACDLMLISSAGWAGLLSVMLIL